MSEILSLRLEEAFKLIYVFLVFLILEIAVFIYFGSYLTC